MYKRRTVGAKRDPVKQWALPDRVFFAAGACHMLAYAFLDRYPDSGFEPMWIRPRMGHTGNHIVVVRRGLVFDYHGFSEWAHYWSHTIRRADQRWPGWAADVVAVGKQALVSRHHARDYEGLWMKEPQEFLFDPMARAHRYLERFPAPSAVSTGAE